MTARQETITHGASAWIRTAGAGGFSTRPGKMPPCPRGEGFRGHGRIGAAGAASARPEAGPPPVRMCPKAALPDGRRAREEAGAAARGTVSGNPVLAAGAFAGKPREVPAVGQPAGPARADGDSAPAAQPAPQAMEQPSAPACAPRVPPSVRPVSSRDGRGGEAAAAPAPRVGGDAWSPRAMLLAATVAAARVSLAGSGGTGGEPAAVPFPEELSASPAAGALFGVALPRAEAGLPGGSGACRCRGAMPSRVGGARLAPRERPRDGTRWHGGERDEDGRHAPGGDVLPAPEGPGVTLWPPLEPALTDRVQEAAAWRRWDAASPAATLWVAATTDREEPDMVGQDREQAGAGRETGAPCAAADVFARVAASDFREEAQRVGATPESGQGVAHVPARDDEDECPSGGGGFWRGVPRWRLLAVAGVVGVALALVVAAAHASVGERQGAGLGPERAAAQAPTEAPVKSGADGVGGVTRGRATTGSGAGAQTVPGGTVRGRGRAKAAERAADGGAAPGAEREPDTAGAPDGLPVGVPDDIADGASPGTPLDLGFATDMMARIEAMKLKTQYARELASYHRARVEDRRAVDELENRTAAAPAAETLTRGDVEAMIAAARLAGGLQPGDAAKAPAPVDRDASGLITGVQGVGTGRLWAQARTLSGRRVRLDVGSRWNAGRVSAITRDGVTLRFEDGREATVPF